MLAAGKGHVDVVNYLLCRQDIDINAHTVEGSTALGFACGSGHLEMAKLLVAAGARVDPQHGKKWKPLGSAAMGGSLQVVKYLVEEAGADVRWVDPDGLRNLMMTADEGHADIAEYLRRAISRREYEVSVALASASTFYNRLT
jgi:ankyrin repeat protein